MLRRILTRKQQPDERYKSIMEKASYVTLMVLFIVGPIILCTMFFIGTFSPVKNLVTISTILTLPLIVLCIIYYIAVFYFRKKLGN
ncbi:MAG: DUF2178 domain-containing protein [Spirochaetales bacterium]|nr:DUF2178 domain-containing protein [Spirochaetales bacterium]